MVSVVIFDAMSSFLAVKVDNGAFVPKPLNDPVDAHSLIDHGLFVCIGHFGFFVRYDVVHFVVPVGLLLLLVKLLDPHGVVNFLKLGRVRRRIPPVDINKGLVACARRGDPLSPLNVLPIKSISCNDVEPHILPVQDASAAKGLLDEDSCKVSECHFNSLAIHLAPSIVASDRALQDESGAPAAVSRLDHILALEFRQIAIHALRVPLLNLAGTTVPQLVSALLFKLATLHLSERQVTSSEHLHNHD